MDIDFDKEFFIKSWGVDGYYENFSYGVGIDKVFEVALNPFMDINKVALEIGCGGGAFTERMVNKFKSLIAIDLIEKPKQFSKFSNFTYIEAPSKDYTCFNVEHNSIDFTFSYNVFCHLSNNAIKEYLKNIYLVSRQGADLIFMISNVNNIQQENKDKYKLGDALPMGHFYQNDKTLDKVIDSKEWQIINRNLIPDHRDIIVHLKKK